ncbi:hypothetical protein PQX77_021991 [Marasmius sp. AFHP31]|nr:hypothetical protein PQX77_021991 [Marasmius sp. AFHP31]
MPVLWSNIFVGPVHEPNLTGYHKLLSLHFQRSRSCLIALDIQIHVPSIETCSDHTLVIFKLLARYSTRLRALSAPYIPGDILWVLMGLNRVDSEGQPLALPMESLSFETHKYVANREYLSNPLHGSSLPNLRNFSSFGPYLSKHDTFALPWDQITHVKLALTGVDNALFHLFFPSLTSLDVELSGHDPATGATLASQADVVTNLTLTTLRIRWPSPVILTQFLSRLSCSQLSSLHLSYDSHTGPNKDEADDMLRETLTTFLLTSCCSKTLTRLTFSTYNPLNAVVLVDILDLTPKLTHLFIEEKKGPIRSYDPDESDYSQTSAFAREQAGMLPELKVLQIVVEGYWRAAQESKLLRMFEGIVRSRSKSRVLPPLESAVLERPLVSPPFEGLDDLESLKELERAGETVLKVLFGSTTVVGYGRDSEKDGFRDIEAPRGEQGTWVRRTFSGFGKTVLHNKSASKQ